MLTPQDETLIEALLTGRRRDDEPEVAARLAAEPELAAALADLRAVQAELDVLGGEADRALRAALAGGPDERATELVARTLGGLPLPTAGAAEADAGPADPVIGPVGDPAGRPAPILRPLWATVAFLAAAALLWLGAGLFGDADGPADTLLGAGLAIEAITADGEGGLVGFEWEAAAGPAGSYRVSLYPVAAADALFEATADEPRWILSPEQIDVLPGAVRVEVEPRPVGGGSAPGGWRVFRPADY